MENPNDETSTPFTRWQTDLLKYKTQEANANLRAQMKGQGHTCVLYPDDTFVAYWTKFITLLLLYTAVVTPYRVAFVEEDTTDWLIVDLVIDSIFFIDVLVIMFLAYYDKENNLEVRNKVIIKSYLKTWMVPDLIACLPFQVILENERNYNSLIRVAKLPRLYRMLKLAKLFRMVKIIKNKDKMKKYINLAFKFNIGVERIIWFIVSFGLMIHLLCCSYVFVGKFMIYEEYDCWIRAGGYEDLSNSELYVVGAYWAAATLTTVGYGDIAANNTFERLICSFVMIIGVLLYSYTIGSLTNLISNMNLRKAELNRKLEILNQLARKHKLSKLFFKKLTKAIEYEYQHSRKEVEELLGDLPPNLSKELLIIIHEKMLKNNAFFSDKSANFVAWVAPRLKTVKVEKGEFIYKEGEYAAEMYFLVKGEASMVALKQADSIPFVMISEGYYFGEVDLLFSESKTHLDSVKAIEACEILTFSREDFSEMLFTFEEEAVEICTAARDRQIRSDEKKEEAERKHALHTMKRRSFSNLANSKENLVEKKHKYLVSEETHQRQETPLREKTRNQIMKNRKTMAGNVLNAISKEDEVVEFRKVKSKVRVIERSVEETKLICKRLFDAFSGSEGSSGVSPSESAGSIAKESEAKSQISRITEERSIQEVPEDKEHELIFDKFDFK